MWRDFAWREHCQTCAREVFAKGRGEVAGPTPGGRRKFPADEEVDHEANARRADWYVGRGKHTAYKVPRVL